MYCYQCQWRAKKSVTIRRNPSNFLPDIENYYNFNIATKFFNRLQIFNATILGAHRITKSQKKNPVLKTLNPSELAQYVVCIKRNCFLHCEISFKTTWEHLNSPEDLSMLFYWLLRSKMSYKLEKKKKVVYSTCHFP